MMKMMIVSFFGGSRYLGRREFEVMMRGEVSTYVHRTRVSVFFLWDQCGTSFFSFRNEVEGIQGAGSQIGFCGLIN